MHTSNYSITTEYFQTCPSNGFPMPYQAMSLEANVPLDAQDVTARATNLPFHYGTADRDFSTGYDVVTPPQCTNMPNLRSASDFWLLTDAPSTWSPEAERVTGEMNGERLLYRPNIVSVSDPLRNGSKIMAAQVESFYCTGNGCQFCKVPKVAPFSSDVPAQ